jgi:hypothetical protein
MIIIIIIQHPHHYHHHSSSNNKWKSFIQLIAMFDYRRVFGICFLVSPFRINKS